jgi:hypothetical protein
VVELRCEKEAEVATAQFEPATARVSEGRSRVLLDEPEAHENFEFVNAQLAGPTSSPNFGGYVVCVKAAPCTRGERVTRGRKAAAPMIRTIKKGSSLASAHQAHESYDVTEGEASIKEGPETDYGRIHPVEEELP